MQICDGAVFHARGPVPPLQRGDGGDEKVWLP